MLGLGLSLGLGLGDADRQRKREIDRYLPTLPTVRRRSIAQTDRQTRSSFDWKRLNRLSNNKKNNNNKHKNESKTKNKN